MRTILFLAILTLIQCSTLLAQLQSEKNFFKIENTESSDDQLSNSKTHWSLINNRSTLNDSIMLQLDSIYYFEIDTNQVIKTTGKIAYKYDLNNEVCERKDYNFSYVTDDWIPSDTQIYLYDEKKRLTKSSHSFWDSTLNRNIITSCVKMSYNDLNSIQIRETYETFQSGELLLTMKEKMKFNNKGQLIEKSVYKLDIQSGILYSTGIIKYLYNNNYQMSEEKSYAANILFDSAIYKTIHYYDTLNRKFSDTNYYYDASLTKYIKTGYVVYGYNQSNRLICYSSFGIDSHFFLMKSIKKEYDYDQQGNRIIERNYKGSTDGTEWILRYTLKSYFDYAVPTINILNSPFTNNYNINKLEGEEVIDSVDLSNKYTSKFYYSEIDLKNILNSQNNLALIFPNPVSDEFIIRFTNQQDNLRFELFDSMGKKLISKNVVHNEHIMTNNYNSGVYFYRFYSEDIIQNGKLIIK